MEEEYKIMEEEYKKKYSYYSIISFLLGLIVYALYVRGGFILKQFFGIDSDFIIIPLLFPILSVTAIILGIKAIKNCKGEYKLVVFRIKLLSIIGIVLGAFGLYAALILFLFTGKIP